MNLVFHGSFQKTLARLRNQEGLNGINSKMEITPTVDRGYQVERCQLYC